MGKGKRIGNEKFNILILSQTDARKKPFSFSFSKRGLAAVLTAAVFFVTAAAGAFSYLLVKSSEDLGKLAALQKMQDEQTALLKTYSQELRALREKPVQAVMADPAPAYIRSPLPSADTPSAAPAESLPASPVRSEPAAGAQKPAVYKGRLGDRFTIEAVRAPAEDAKKKAKWASSNAKVAKVSKEGEVTLTGPGTATISLYGAGTGNAKFKVTCVSQFGSVHYCQGDSKWGFPDAVERKACIITSFAILLQNAGVKATPRTVYSANHSLSLRFPKLLKAFPVKFVNALSGSSPYLKSFNGSITTIKEPSKNYVAAVKEALNRHPEGVCLYFKGRGAHMMVAVGYTGNDIYYSDPGRVKTKGHLVTFKGTWTYYKHRMTYKDVKYLVAIDVNN